MTTSLTDGSWELKVMISDLQTERSLRVHGSMHIGALMLKLVDSLKRDWSGFGLFWNDKNSWLTNTKITLDQLGVTSTSNLMFTCMHKHLTVVLPDLQTIHTLVDFSANVFNVVAKICADLGIRHFEELSLCHHLNAEELKKNRGVSATRRTHFGLSASHNDLLSTSPNRLSCPSTPQGTLGHRSTIQRTTPTHLTTPTHQSFSPSIHCSPASNNSFLFDLDNSLITSPQVEAFKPFLHFPKNLAEKARINAGWLDSSRSLLEQGMKSDDLLLLRFKFHNYHELNTKLDQVRINQLYEQAKWSVVSEEIDCTEEEMVTLAALQLQIEQQSSLPNPTTTTIATPTTPTDHTDDDDEIDAALDDLQVTLEGNSYLQHINGDNNRNSDLTHVPELKAIMKFYKLKKFGLRSSRKQLFVLRDTTLFIFHPKHQEQQKPTMTLQLKGCEVTADVIVSSQKFLIKIIVPPLQPSLPNFEYCLRPDSEKLYAEWMAALKLGTQGRTMADSCYGNEVQAILSFLTIHHPNPLSKNKTSILKDNGFLVEYFVAPRFVSKIRGTTQLQQRIVDAQMNIGHIGVVEAKMSYIRLWQSLPEYALTYFIIRHKNAKKEELLAITPTRLIRMDLLKGDVIKSWSFKSLESWNVNWEIKQVHVCLEGEDLRFQCLTADCKVVHEFIGGYIFLSMRSSDPQQPLDHSLFHKLTSGWE